MSFSPNKEDLEAGMEGVVARLEETLLCIKPLVMDPLFFPFTRPVLYGKQEDMVFKVNSHNKGVMEGGVGGLKQLIYLTLMV